MVAIANFVIDNWSGEPGQIFRPIYFVKGPGLTRRIRATYNLRRDDVEHEREEDIYNDLRGVRLLLLDDVGKEKPSDFTRELYWYHRRAGNQWVAGDNDLPASSLGQKFS